MRPSLFIFTSNGTTPADISIGNVSVSTIADGTSSTYSLSFVPISKLEFAGTDRYCVFNPLKYKLPPNNGGGGEEVTVGVIVFVGVGDTPKV